MKLTVFVLLLLFLSACYSSQPGRIGGGYGESLVLECSTQQPCPAEYECRAQQGQQTGMCQRTNVPQ